MSVAAMVGFHAFEQGDKPPARLLLLADGDIGWDGLDATLDQKAADRIIASFEAQGVELPIDYHHATSKVEDGETDKAPAAGWIKGLKYVKGEGLYADPIEWTEAAAKAILAREFKYHSPIIFTNKETGDITELHSVALTNRPRTIDQVELLQAAERLEATLNKESGDMPKLKATKKKAEKAETVKEVAQEDMDGAPAVDEAQGLMAKLIVLLQEKGGTIADDAPLAEVLRVTLEMLGAGDLEAPTEEPEEASADTEAKPDTSVESAELRVKAAAYDRLNERLKTLEGERATKQVDSMIETQIQAGKLLPDDTTLVAAAREFAESNPKGFEKLYGAMAPIYEPGKTSGATLHCGSAASGSRKRIITEASKQHDDGAADAKGVEKRFYVGAALQVEELDPLSKAEIEALK